MGTSMLLKSFLRIKAGIAAVMITALCLVTIPVWPAGGIAEAADVKCQRATFDLFSMFPKQMLSPKTGSTSVSIPLETRNIEENGTWISLSANCDSGYFSAAINPSSVHPRGDEGIVQSSVLVKCAPDTPDGTNCWIKIVGKRGLEKHHVWLKVSALASQPRLARDIGVPVLGQGYKDPVTQAFTGEPLVWNLSAANYGGGDDIYTLGYQSEFSCQVRFLDSKGNEIHEVAVKALTRNYLYPGFVYFKAEVTPTAPIPKNKSANVTFILGPGGQTGSTSAVDVRVVNPGMLFCISESGGLRPHAHQVMAGEVTTYLLHVTNLDGIPSDITLSLTGSAPGWEVGLDTDKLTGLPPGQTRQATLKVKAPQAGPVGERLDICVEAESSHGTHDEVNVSAEATSVRNVYYWSIDSMDPEYLYLNRAGTGPGSPGDWLMPGLHAFLDQGVNYTNARAFLPAATDMNHTNALAGTYTGTAGVFLVGGTVRGFDAHDEDIGAPNSMDLMKYGPDGKPVERIYEVAKKKTGGKALCGFWSNKNWLADLEGERTVDIVGNSERFPLFFPAPRKYIAGDPSSDADPNDPLSGPFSMSLYSDTLHEILIPTLLGQFSLLLGLGMYIVPVSLFFGLLPGSHAEDQYLKQSFFRSILEEDPDVSYINVADLDNTGHFTGSSWTQDEWDTKGTPGAADDESVFSPWMRRDECLDICRDVDILFGQFIDLLKQRGVYDNSVIVVLSDHGMENVKDPRKVLEGGKKYQIIDLRKVLRERGILYKEDFHENGGAGSVIWCDDPLKTAKIESILEQYTVDDPLLGKVCPLTVVNRREMRKGVDFGSAGRVLPKELYSQYWINNPDPVNGHQWPELFVFPRYHYNICTHGQVLSGGFNPIGISLGNIPDSVQMGFPAYHGGLDTSRIPLILKAPAGYRGYTPGGAIGTEVRISDIAPTIYQIMGWERPGCVDGTTLPEP